MSEEKHVKNVYGENHPKEEDAPQEDGIREKVADEDKDTGDDLEETRRKMSREGQSGGMGREGTPKPETTQGTWSRPEEE